MGPFLYRLGRAAVRRRRLVIALWLTAVIVITAAARLSSGGLKDDFAVPGVDSRQALELLRAEFPARAGGSAQIVVHATAGTLTEPAEANAVTATVIALQNLPHVVAVLNPLDNPGRLSPDSSIALIEVDYDQTSRDLGASAYEALKDATTPARTAGLQVEYGGELPTVAEQGSLPPSELIGIAAAIVILLFAFGSVIAMGLPIATALFGLAVGITTITFMGAFVTIPNVATTIAAMIGLGVGIDYALFIITRHRQGLHRGLTVEDAAGRAIATSGQAVVFAGGTVVIAICGLAVAGIPAVTMMGIGAAVVVAIMVLAALTLLPALLGFAGPAIDRLRVPGMRPKVEQGARDADGNLHGWGRWGHHVASHPWPYLLASLAVVIGLAAPALSLRLGQPDAGTNPTSSTLRRSYDLLSTGFGPGFNGPLQLSVDLTPVTGDTSAALADITTAVAADPDVAVVRAPTINQAGSAAIIQVLPRSSPQDAATEQLVKRLRHHVLRATATTGAHTYVGGPTATWIDLSDRVAERLPLFIATIIGLSFLLLACVFRSILVPLKAALMNVLSIAAAYGVIVAIFQKGWGASLVGVHTSLPIISFIPMFMFAVLFGLSMDYEVFLLSRIREEYVVTGDNTDSVVTGIATTARVITSAALIMISVFLAFVLGDNPTVKMLGIGLATAVFIDATLVRIVLVPATMRLLGDANWWLPRRLDRVLPRLDIEGEHRLPEPQYTDPRPVADPELEPAPA